MEDKTARLNNVCLDASVIVKLLTHEQDSHQAAAFFRQLIKKNSKIVEPLFLKVEVYSTLRKKSFLRELSGKKIRTSLDFFGKLPLEFKTEDKTLLDESLKLAERLSMSVIYDCVYLVLAKRERATFVTADKKFIRKAKRVYKNSLVLSEV